MQMCVMKRIFFCIAASIVFFETLLSQPVVPKFTVSVCDTSARGYYLFSPIQIGKAGPLSGFTDVILDAKGKLVYLKNYEEGFLAGSLTQEKNGKYTYLFDTKYYVMDSLFRPLDTVYCQNGIFTDSHDFLILPNGNYALLGYESTTMDLSKFFFFKKNGTQGLSNAMVKSGVIQELSPDKKVVFEWHSKEHYAFDDIDTFYVSNLYDIDWTHFNSLEYDIDGNYLVSVKHFNEITKVNRKNGSIMWRLGGNRNQFGFLNDSLKFMGQHHIRRLPNRFITLYDNGFNRGTFHPETAKEYRIDEFHKSVTLIWSHVNNAKQWSYGYGSVQIVPGKTTLISYGRSDKGQVIFNQLNQKNKIIYEVRGRDSLYSYRASHQMHLPVEALRPKIIAKNLGGAVSLEVSDATTSCYWNTDEQAKKITVTRNGFYQVCVPFGPNGYLYSVPIYIEGGRISNKE